MPTWLAAGIWGFVAGAALLVGAGLGYALELPRRLVAGIMAFGAGVLVSALCFELMDDAVRTGGFTAAAIGFIVGASIYSGANLALARRGAKHRKRSDRKQPAEQDQPGSGLALLIGALIDGIPESIAIGVSLIAGGAVSWVTVAAVFISNVPEGLSSSVGMRRAGRKAGYVFGVWFAVTALSAGASLVGAVAFRGVDPSWIAGILGVAAGGILAMLSDTMIPEAFSDAHDLSGLITALGFLCAFFLSKVGG